MLLFSVVLNYKITYSDHTNAYNKNKRDWKTNRQDVLNNVDSQIESSRIDLNNRIMDARQKQKTASIGTIKSRISVYEQSAVFDFS